MIVGLNARDTDIAVNVCKEKQQTNIRNSTGEIAVKLTTPMRLSLEQSLDFIGNDELVEVTPAHPAAQAGALEQRAGQGLPPHESGAGSAGRGLIAVLR